MAGALCLRRNLSCFVGVLAGLGLLAASAARAEVWRSPVHDWSFFQIAKPLANPGLDLEVGAGAAARFRALPSEVTSALASRSVEYESALAGYLPAERAAAFAARLDALGLRYTLGLDHRIPAQKPSTATTPLHL